MRCAIDSGRLEWASKLFFIKPVEIIEDSHCAHEILGGEVRISRFSASSNSLWYGSWTVCYAWEIVSSAPDRQITSLFLMTYWLQGDIRGEAEGCLPLTNLPYGTSIWESFGISLIIEIRNGPVLSWWNVIVTCLELLCQILGITLG